MPELGPSLGRLTDPAQPAVGPLGVRLDDIRLTLVTGIFELAGAGSGGDTAGDGPDDALREIDWMHRLSAKIGRPVAFALLQFDSRPEQWRELMEICERIHVLDQGVTLAEGTPDEIRANLDVTAAYLGERAVQEEA